MKENTRIESAIKKGLAFIANEQERDGHFASISAKNVRTFSHATLIRHTTFHTSLITKALAAVPNDPTALQIAQKALRFLLAERSTQWSFNYWKKGTPEYTSIRCPDDLDDTSAALSAINEWGPRHLNERAVLAYTEHLIHAETKTGGPYNTWLIANYHETPWEDIDIGVQANIIDFLSSINIHLPETVAYIQEKLKKDGGLSKYYPPLFILYTISRWLTDNSCDQMLTILTQYAPDRNATPLAVALYTAAALRYGAKTNTLRREIKRLRTLQQADGSWDAAPFFIEQYIDKTPNWSGSRALTSAYAIETLAIYKHKMREEKRNIEHEKVVQKSHAIKKMTQKQFSKHSIAIQQSLAVFINAIDHKDPSCEITLLPHFFAKALKKPTCNNRAVEMLCSMNLLGWIGYTIYDKILDGESAIEFLPLANSAVRNVFAIITKLLPRAEERNRAYALLATIDQTNFWEYHACKMKKKDSRLLIPEHLPDYKHEKRLAEKSIGHMLGPLILLLRQKTSRQVKEKRITQFTHYFIHYLAARQLNDDAHDWLGDLENGFINSASTELLAIWRAQHRTYIIYEKDKNALQKIFWDKIIDRIARRIIHHIKAARRTLDEMSFLHDTDFLARSLAPLEHSARTAINERNSTRKLISLYNAQTTRPSSKSKSSSKRTTTA